MKDLTKRDVLHWILGTLLCTLGVCLTTKADFGLSMIAAVPYTLHVGFRDAIAWFSQGTAEYLFQAFLLIFTCFLVWRFRWKFLLSFATAFICGLCIDGWLLILGGNAPYESLGLRIAVFFIGVLLMAAATALYFRSKLPLQVYELTVAEISDRFNWKLEVVKSLFDILMLVLAVVLSVMLTGSVFGAGVGWGTLVITFCNAPLIKLFGSFYDKWKL